MDSFIEAQEKELFRRLLEKHDAEAAATGGPTYDEIMRSFKEWREQQAILRARMNLTLHGKGR